MNRLIKYIKRNGRLGSMHKAMMILIVALTLVSCELDTCRECYDVTRTVYYPEFSTYTETVCYEISCDE